MHSIRAAPSPGAGGIETPNPPIFVGMEHGGSRLGGLRTNECFHLKLKFLGDKYGLKRNDGRQKITEELLFNPCTNRVILRLDEGFSELISKQAHEICFEIAFKKSLRRDRYLQDFRSFLLWQVHIGESVEDTYYWNPLSGEVQWQRPSRPAEPPRLTSGEMTALLFSFCAWFSKPKSNAKDSTNLHRLEEIDEWRSERDLHRPGWCESDEWRSERDLHRPGWCEF